METNRVLIMERKPRKKQVVKPRKKQPPLRSLPLVTGQVSEELGITISKEFIMRKLKVRPLLDTRVGAYWDDINLIKARLGEYFTKASKL